MENYLLLGTARTKGVRRTVGARRTKGTIRTGFGRFTRGGFLTKATYLGRGALGAKRALVEIGTVGARGALLKVEKLGTERTFLMDGTLGTRGTDRKAQAMEEKAKQTPTRKAVLLRNATSKLFHGVFGFQFLQEEGSWFKIFQNRKNFVVFVHPYLRNDDFGSFWWSV